HLLRQLAGEEWHEEEVQLARLTQMLDARIAKADRLAHAVRKHRHIAFSIERNAEAGSVQTRAQLRMCLHMHDDAIAVETHLRVLCVGVARRSGLAAKVIAAVLREELLVQRPLQRLWRDVQFNGVCRSCKQSR